MTPPPPTKEITSKSTRTPLRYLNYGFKNITTTLWPETPLTSGEKRATNSSRTPILHTDDASQLSTLSTPTSAWQVSILSSTRTAHYTPTKKSSGKNSPPSQKLCSLRGNPHTTWSAWINAPLSPNVSGTTNINTSTSANNLKCGPLSFKILHSLPGAEFYQETEIINHPETEESAQKPTYDIRSEKQNKKGKMVNRETEKDKKKEGNTKVKKSKNNYIAEVTPPNPTTRGDALSSGNGDGDCPTPPVLMPRANECSATKTNFRVYSHNVHGLRDETKLEHIPRIMKTNNLDAYLIQETHLAGDFEKLIMFDYYLIHHGPEIQPSNGAKGGVAIILSPDLASVWKNSGKGKRCIRGGMSVGNTTRFLSVNLRFETSKENTTTKKLETYHNLCLTSIYFPHSGYKEQDIEKFNDDVSDFLSSILSKSNTTHIIGADTNSSVGTKTSVPRSVSIPDKHESQHDIDPILELLGPHGNPHKSKTGDGVLNLMREHRLRAASTFFDNNRKYNTWLGLPNPTTGKRKAYQIDHILIPYHQLCLTSNVKRKFNGVVSDHAALLVEFRLLNFPLLKNKNNNNKGKQQTSVDSKPPQER
jgi:exonuclease III